MQLIIFCCLLLSIISNDCDSANTSGKKRSYIPNLLWMKGDDNLFKFIPECRVNVTYNSENIPELEGTVYLAEDIPDDTKIDVVGFQKNVDKSWQTVPSLKLSYKACDFLMQDQTILSPGMIKGSTLKRECPLKKGLYTLTNAKFGETWPNHITGDYWLIKASWAIDEKRGFALEGEVYMDKTVLLETPAPVRCNYKIEN